MNTAVILWSLVFGSVGFGYFLYGKKQSNVIAKYTGITLMIFPYFVQETTWIVLTGCILLAVPKFVKL